MTVDVVAAPGTGAAGGDGAIEATPGAAWPDEFPPRVVPATWPQTAQSREAVLDRLLAAPFLPSSAAVGRLMAHGLVGPAGPAWRDLAGPMDGQRRRRGRP